MRGIGTTVAVGVEERDGDVEREGLTLRGGLRRRVTINDCEMRIQRSVSVQREEKNEGDERGIP